MHIAYAQAGSFALVRDFLADVVALLRREAAGAWTLVSSTPLPHEGHGPLDVLARTEWRLGAARLLQSVEGGDGNPRDGYGFLMSVELSVPGLDGALRRVSLQSGSWEPCPAQLCFTLAGFTGAEFLQARAAGCARFVNDDTANAVWAAHNVEELCELGDRSVARGLAAEALERPGPAWARNCQQQLRRAMVELTDDPSGRALAESRVLLGDTTEYERLARVASGALSVPQWTARAAAHVQAVMQPWETSAATQLDAVARRWFDHPWWRPARAEALGAWSCLRSQAFDSRRENFKWILTPRGEPGPLAAPRAVQVVRKALELTDVDASIPRDPVIGGHAGEGFVVRLDGDVACVRAMVHYHVRDQAFEYRWSWLWTGEGLEGAVVVTRLAVPSDPHSEPVPLENHISWLGGDEVTARFARALLADNGDLRISPP